MRTEVIKADSIDAAVERVLDELKADGSVIYFDGWEGLGASAVLRGVAQRLAMASSEGPSAGLQFGQIIHIDCSKWENMRMLQRAIAEQLMLPDEVMDMFDTQDEEDDFSAVDQGSRGVIEQVLKMMHRRIQELNRRFLVIFHNGGSEEIDLATFGFPISGYYSTSKVLWSFQGRFRLYPRAKVDDALNNNKSPSETKTHVFLSASPLERHPQELVWSYLVGLEAAEVAAAAGGIHGRPASSQVAECFLYMWKLCYVSQHLRIDYDLATHGSNYWVCDGIITNSPQQENDQGQKVVLHTTDDVDSRPWRIADALQHEMRLDTDYYSKMQSLPSNFTGTSAESMATMSYWSSPALGAAFGVLLPPTEVEMLPQHSHQNKLAVLKLSRCTFSLSSPPLHRCHNLRFLWLDHCQYHHEEGIGKGTDEEAAAATGSSLKECFQRLWVLDVRYTCCDGILSAEMMRHMTQLRELNVEGARDWDMGQMQGCLPNIRKLRVTKSTILCSGRSNLFSGLDKMKLLNFSGNRNIGGMESLSTENNNSLLETVIINGGCAGLEHTLFRGCTKLKNVLLRGAFKELKSIDISGTAVKTLDLSSVKPAHQNLIIDKVVALGCDKLRAVLWSPEAKWNEGDLANKLWIDTTVESTSSATSSSSAGSRAPIEPDDHCGYISVSDARLLQSLVTPFESYLDEKALVQLEISSPDLADAGGSKEGTGITTKRSEQLLVLAVQEQQPTSVLYEGVAVALKEQITGRKGLNDSPASITQIWPCPPAPGRSDWYLYIQDRIPIPVRSSAGGSYCSRLPDMICRNTKMLHVHDSKSITCVSPLQGSTWTYLRWCRVERCPCMDNVFICPAVSDNNVPIFCYLETLWSSQLLRVRCIWNLSRVSSVNIELSFDDLRFVHVDLCPRLTHVLPLWWCDRLRSLETLEILWCGDLREVFPRIHIMDNDDHQQQQQQETNITTVEFPFLKRIHLHELPMLHGICGRGSRMSAPRLESIKIRGCWSLASLPVLDDVDRKAECDCEKEWWDMLKWDAKHRYYNPTHPRHYKKMPLLRTSVLR